jgi:hypothetical protein
MYSIIRAFEESKKCVLPRRSPRYRAVFFCFIPRVFRGFKQMGRIKDKDIPGLQSLHWQIWGMEWIKTNKLTRVTFLPQIFIGLIRLILRENKMSIFLIILLLAVCSSFRIIPAHKNMGSCAAVFATYEFCNTAKYQTRVGCSSSLSESSMLVRWIYNQHIMPLELTHAFL